MAIARRLGLILNDGTPFFEEGFDVSDPGNEQELINFVTPSGLKRKLAKVDVLCRAEGKFEILEDATVIGSGRTGAASPNASFEWAPPREVATGSTIKVQFKSRNGSAVSDVEAYLMASDFT